MSGLGIPHDILLDSKNNLFASAIKLKTSEECCYTERKFDDQKRTPSTKMFRLLFAFRPFNKQVILRLQRPAAR